MKTEFLKHFEELTKELFVMSETDAPITPFFWEIKEEITPELVAKHSEKPENERSPIEKIEFKAFFEKYTQKEDWYGEDELAVVTKFENLEKELSEKLTDLVGYRVGKINIDVFVVGKITNDKKEVLAYAGIKTFVVET
jgi:hypothetical protein